MKPGYQNFEVNFQIPFVLVYSINNDLSLVNPESITLRFCESTNFVENLLVGAEASDECLPTDILV